MANVIQQTNSLDCALKPKSFYACGTIESANTVRPYLTPLQRKKIRELKNVTLEITFLEEDKTPVKENTRISTKNTNRKLRLTKNTRDAKETIGIPKKPKDTTAKPIAPGKILKNRDSSATKSFKYNWAPASLGRNFFKVKKNFDPKKLSIPKSPQLCGNLSKTVVPSSVEEVSFCAKRKSGDFTAATPDIHNLEEDVPPSKRRLVDKDFFPESPVSDVEEDKENGSKALLSKSLPLSLESEKEKTKFYPIFNKSATSKSDFLLSGKLGNSKQSNTANETVSPMTPKNLLAKLPGTPKTRSGTLSDKSNRSPDEKQMIIDAGQKKFGAQQCGLCRMMYSANHPADEQEHVTYHKRFLNYIRFLGWKRERIVSSFMDGRILKVVSTDAKYAINKVEDILTIVDKDLGFKIAHCGFSSSKSAYLYVSDEEKIVGCLIAEKISQAYRLKPIESEKDDSDPKNVICYTEPTPVPVVCGVSRIWTYAPMRRRKIATRLVDALRSSFVLGSDLDMDQVAFSDPTPDGRAFATKYFKNQRVLVYNFVR